MEAVRALKTYGRWIPIDDPGAVNPVATLEYLARPETERTPIAELADIEKLLATCDGDTMEDARDKVIICLLRATGMRRGELAQMEWSHVDRDAMTVRLPPRNTKSGKGRTVCYDRDTAQAMRLYVRRLERWEDENRRDFSHTDRVWIGRLGPLSSNGIGQMIERRAKVARVDITAHAFRRSLAVRWLREGRSETLLQRVAGWADPKMVGQGGAALARRPQSDPGTPARQHQRRSGSCAATRRLRRGASAQRTCRPQHPGPPAPTRRTTPQCAAQQNGSGRGRSINRAAARPRSAQLPRAGDRRLA